MKEVLIIDQIGGNIGSIYKTLSRLKINVRCSSEAKEILQAERIIMPGLGHFGNAIQRINTLHFKEQLQEAVLIRKTPILGICLGIQMFCNFSEEGNVKGLEWIDAEVKRFNFSDTFHHKIPHIGWNTIEPLQKDHPLFYGVYTLEYFYFVHSYYVQCNYPQNCLAETEYEHKFASVIQKENIFGVQFHPEKSYGAGEKLLMNFINL